MTELVTANAELALRIRNGDERAEAELFSRFQAGIRQIIVRVTGSFALAEELGQETLIVTLRRLRSGSLEDPSKLAAFMAQTARNLAIAEKRKEQRRRTDSGGEEIETLEDKGVSHEATVQTEAAAVAVRKVLQELRSERDRHILVRHYLHDEDRELICRELGITAATFNVILFRARKQFLKLLERRGIRRTDLFCFVLL